MSLLPAGSSCRPSCPSRSSSCLLPSQASRSSTSSLPSRPSATSPAPLWAAWTASRPIRSFAGGIISQGILSIIGAVFGALPTSTYGQNVGIVTQTRVINRNVFTTAALILIAAGLLPKFAALLSGIPQAVIGGATVNVFGTITMTGIRILSQKGLTPRNASIAGLSVALGMGIALTSGCLAGSGMPEWISEVFGDSAVIVTAIVAIILNLVLPKGGPDSDVVEAVKGAQQIAQEGVSALYESAAKGTPAVELQQEKMEKQKKE